MSTDPLVYDLIAGRVKARTLDLNFPPEIREQTKALLSEAEHSLIKAKSLYERVSEIHAASLSEQLTPAETVA